MRSKVYVFIMAGILLSGCDSNRIYDEYQSVPDSWNKDDLKEFTLIPPDTTDPYNVFINIRNTDAYKFSNLFLITEMAFPNGKVLKDTLEYRMTNAKGEFLGRGFSDVKENKLWYKETIVFNENGEYTFRIGHAMRKNGEVKGIENLEGILDVGLRIEIPKTESQ